MNPLTQFENATTPLQLSLLVAFFGLCEITQALSPAPDGGYPGGNTAEGQAALLSLTTGGFNTGVGFLSLRSNIIGSFNTAIGAGTLLANTADQNTATGAGALLSNTDGNLNTANGAFALFSNTTASGNTAIGVQALVNTTTGFGGNTAVGFQALLKNTSGNANTAIGAGALPNNTTGGSNIALGINAGFHITTANNVICIGSDGADARNSCFIGNIRGVTTANTDAVPVLIDSAGQLGTASSSRRFKKAIKRMDNASEAILALKPVTFHYKSDNTNTPQFGLIAEDVAEVNPELVVRDKDGQIYTVRYDAVNAMLLNEFLKEHKTVQELKSTAAKQEVTIAELQSTVAQEQQGMKVLRAQLKEQAAQIQKASIQIQIARPARQMVLNNP